MQKKHIFVAMEDGTTYVMKGSIFVYDMDRATQRIVYLDVLAYFCGKYGDNHLLGEVYMRKKISPETSAMAKTLQGQIGERKKRFMPVLLTFIYKEVKTQNQNCHQLNFIYLFHKVHACLSLQHKAMHNSFIRSLMDTCKHGG